MALYPSWIETLLNSERNSTRFEAFCLALLAAEGINLVPTSKTYDLGRDGRRASRDAPGKMDVLCVSLERDVLDKAASDAERLSGTTLVNDIYFCSSRELTEHALKQVEEIIRAKHPDANIVETFGATQIIDIALRHEEIVEQHYSAELDSIRRALLPSPATDGAEEKALRIALMTQTGDDALELRQTLSKRLVLESVANLPNATPAAIAAHVSQQLRLPTTISEAYINGIVQSAVSEGLVIVVDGVISLTVEGTEAVDNIPAAAPAHVLEGRQVIADAIHILSGHNLQADAFNRFWRRFQDNLANTFYLHASTMVNMVAAILNGDTPAEVPRARELIEALARSSTAEFTSPQQRDEVAQAVIDMFFERSSRAFEWLSSVCSTFVILCSLGLEVRSAAETSKTLRAITLLLDTDILISLLCEKESNHDEVLRICTVWQGLRGRIKAAEPALEEAAYHAWIATTEFESTADLLARLTDVEAEHLLNNAFVRTFRIHVGRRITRRLWDLYINGFRGEDEHDFAKVLLHLREEYRIEKFEIARPNVEEEAIDIYRRMQQHMIRSRAAVRNVATDELDPRVVDKSRRDALLLASVQLARRRIRALGGRETVVVVSSSPFLQRLDREFRPELGEPESVISLPAVAVLLSLVPGVSMTLGTLKGVLFDQKLSRRLGPLQQYVYRLIARSDEYDLPWSKRVTLQDELRKQLVRDAKSGSKSPEEIEFSIVRGQDPEHSAEVVKRALDRMAIDPESDKRIAEQAKTIAEQEREIARLRALVQESSEHRRRGRDRR